jgi:hypothetical protein
MPHTSYPFAHRPNRNGTTDSICKTCFATVGTAEQSEHLRTIEDAHVCDTWRLDVIKVVAGKKPKAPNN